MPKVYSRSQGKVIEQPGAQAGGMGGGGDGGMMGGMDPQMMKQLFTLLMLQDPSQISKLTQLYGFMAPTEETAAEKKTQKGLEDSISGGLYKLNEIRGILDKYGGQDVAGLSPALKAGFGKGISREGPFGGLAPGEGTNILQAALSDYNTRLFEIAGKAFTDPEKGLLEGLILDIGDDELRMKDKMAQAEQMIRLRAQQQGVQVPGSVAPQAAPTQQPQAPQRQPAYGFQPSEPTQPPTGKPSGIMSSLMPRTSGFLQSSKEQPWSTKEKLPVLLGGPLGGMAFSERYRKEALPAGMESFMAYTILKSLLGTLGGKGSPLQQTRDVTAGPEGRELLETKRMGWAPKYETDAPHEQVVAGERVARDVQKYMRETQPLTAILDTLLGKQAGTQTSLRGFLGGAARAIPKAVGTGIGFGLGGKLGGYF